MRIALIRHLPTAIAPGHCYGRLDLAPGPGDPAPLLAQLAQLAQLQGFGPAPVLASPARRCHGLALQLATGRPVTLDPRLLELDFGAWEGLPWDAVPRAALDRWAADPWGFAPPGGESGATLVARVSAFHAALRGDSVIVAHGGPLKVLAALLQGRPVDLLAPSQPMGSLLLIDTASATADTAPAGQA